MASQKSSKIAKRILSYFGTLLSRANALKKKLLKEIFMSSLHDRLHCSDGQKGELSHFNRHFSPCRAANIEKFYYSSHFFLQFSSTAKRPH